jgi:hypothetical protein
MKQYLALLLFGLAIPLAISCNRPAIHPDVIHSGSTYGYFGNRRGGAAEAHPLFKDETQQVVSCAERLVDSNEREGAALDQRWYGLQYFGKYPDLIFGADKVIFFGGLESQVKTELHDRYTSIDPLENDQDPAADERAIKSADVSVDSVIVETTTWVTKMKARGLTTVDQESFHIMNAINSSAYAQSLDLYIGTLVTDNVSSDVRDTGVTLEHAEEVISQTTGGRKEFIAEILRRIGLLRNSVERMRRQD